MLKTRLVKLLYALNEIAHWDGLHEGEDVGVLKEIARDAIREDIALSSSNNKGENGCTFIPCCGMCLQA
jgi:hypothetical protein